MPLDDYRMQELLSIIYHSQGKILPEGLHREEKSIFNMLECLAEVMRECDIQKNENSTHNSHNSLNSIHSCSNNGDHCSNEDESSQNLNFESENTNHSHNNNNNSNNNSNMIKHESNNSNSNSMNFSKHLNRNRNINEVERNKRRENYAYVRNYGHMAGHSGYLHRNAVQRYLDRYYSVNSFSSGNSMNLNAMNISETGMFESAIPAPPPPPPPPLPIHTADPHHSSTSSTSSGSSAASGDDVVSMNDLCGNHSSVPRLE